MVSKSKFSMFMRTLCDRELYLSLFSNNPSALDAAGIPVPLKSRPGVQLITNSGQEFEYEQFDLLLNAFPTHVFHKSAGRTRIDLSEALTKATVPSLILQPGLEPEEFRDVALSSLGVSAESRKVIPRLSGLRPDILFVDERHDTDYEILPDGSRLRVAADDPRTPLSVIDLKNITEANASYSAEVCLYAIFLASWLHSEGSAFKKRYFISDRIFLWRHTEMPAFTEIMKKKDGGEVMARLQALRSDLDDGLVNYLVYMPSVRKFFVEDLPRVVAIGDDLGWAALDYHVNQKCGACDWLGNRSWLSTDDHVFFDKDPTKYCFQGAESSDHLCKMPTLSKGATRILKDGGHPEVGKLVGIQSNATILRGHTLLKKDRDQIGSRAEAITTGNVTVDLVSKVGGLAKYLGAEFDIVVNFDSGSGLLTGVALRGTLFAPFGHKFQTTGGEAQTIHPLGEAAFVVAKDNTVAEWAALNSFIERLATWIDDARKVFGDHGMGTLRTQICFWELRQYTELCNAFGRHLLDILQLSGRSQRALAWIFPAEELMEKAEQICPNIVFIKDIVTASVRLPQRFAVTLLGTAEAYHHDRLTPRKIDSYYVEPLGNGIPRERIFEIWKSPTGTVRMFGRVVSVFEAVDRYGAVLKAHTWAISSIVARLRMDLKDCISGNAPELSMSIPSGLSSVAYDSKLWDRWASVSAAVGKTEGLHTLIARPEWLEAAYQAVILEAVINTLGGNRYEFAVSADSTEAKIEVGDFCTIGIVSHPGFPLKNARTLGVGLDDYTPMHRVISAKIESFDRASARITVRLEPSWNGAAQAFQTVMASGLVPIGSEPIYLLPTMPFDDYDQTREILIEIGDPSVATPSTEAKLAMGHSAIRKIPKGTGIVSPVARVLWQGDAIAKTLVRTAEQTEKLADFATTANAYPLNESQVKAVRICCQRQLSIIWGPPGTGKTDTLVAMLHAMVREGPPRKILITGPNYRTVEELSGRLLKNLEADPAAIGDFFWLYSKSRTPKKISNSNQNLIATTAKLDFGEDLDDIQTSVRDPQRTTIISTTAHMVLRLTKAVSQSGSALDKVFDVIVLDESSQIPMTLAIKPLAAMNTNAQVIVAGDHKQMPPIQSLDPPKGAEYLVDSIQTYLIKRFGIAQQPLLVNYRSNQDLVDYARSLGYPAQLVAATPKKDLSVLNPLDGVVKTLPAALPRSEAYVELLRPERRVSALIHDDPTSSQANDLEAGLVAGLAFIARHAMAKDLDTGGGISGEAFTDETFFESGIGIVTPHKAQKALVIRKLTELFPSADPELVYSAVDTVERFQGGERNLIIVSYGVGDTDIIEGEEQFLLQLERTNVAVSRAKAKCIVLMPKSLAYHLPSDQKAAETSVALKSYLEEFCGERLAVNIQDGAGTVRAAEIRWH